MRGRRPAILGVLAVVLALGALLVLSRPTQDPYQRPPLDPRGTGPEGLRAVVELLRAFGSDVRIGGIPSADDDVTLQPRDTLSGAPARRLRAWVRDGGTLVVTDPDAALAAAGDNTGLGPVPSFDPDRCDLEALSDIDRLGVAMPRPFAVRPGLTACFSDDRRAALVVDRLGSGLVVSLSTPGPLLNENLGRADDAALAVALLGDRPGRSVRILDPNRFISDREVGDGTVLGALPRRARQGVAQVIVAFLIWGVVRGRRLGQPVPEELPVPVPGSDLVLAVGEMLARGDDVHATADRLRRRARRQLGIAMGLGPDPDPRLLADSLSAHVSMDRPSLDRALVDPVADVDTLIDVAHRLDRLQEELHGTHNVS